MFDEVTYGGWIDANGNVLLAYAPEEHHMIASDYFDEYDSYDNAYTQAFNDGWVRFVWKHHGNNMSLQFGSQLVAKTAAFRTRMMLAKLHREHRGSGYSIFYDVEWGNQHSTKDDWREVWRVVNENVRQEEQLLEV